MERIRRLYAETAGVPFSNVSVPVLNKSIF